MNVFVEHIDSIDRGLGYAVKFDLPEVGVDSPKLGLMASGLMSRLVCVEILIRLYSPLILLPGTHMKAQVIEISNHVRKQEGLVRYLQMAHRTLRNLTSSSITPLFFTAVFAGQKSCR